MKPRDIVEILKETAQSVRRAEEEWDTNSDMCEFKHQSPTYEGLGERCKHSKSLRVGKFQCSPQRCPLFK